MTAAVGGFVAAAATVATLPLVTWLRGELGYVTAAQKAALKVFNASGPYLAGTVASATSHAVDATGGGVVCDLVLEAAHAGATVNTPTSASGDAYCPLANRIDWFGAVGAATEVYGNGGQEMKWANLASYDDDQLTAFGLAVKHVLQAKDALSDASLASAMDACNACARAMDDVGVLAQAPADVTVGSWLYDHTLGKWLPSTGTLVLGGALLVGGLYVTHKAGVW